MRRFNVTGVCVPEKYYMVDISDKLAQIKEMVDNGDYFTINHITKMCKPSNEVSGKKFVLMVDEVDRTSENRTYLLFLGMLLDKYLLRSAERLRIL